MAAVFRLCQARFARGADAASNPKPCISLRSCLLAGDAHDTAAVFRLCQLWFALGADAAINAALAATLAAVPSWKFLPLAYQMASRMSATRAGPLHKSGFQVRAAL